MSDDLVKRLGRLARMAETANHWTDEHRLMPAAGVADIVYEAKDRIEELEAQLAKAIEALRITDRWLRELDMYASPDYHLVPSLQKVRDTLKELTGGKDGC